MGTDANIMFTTYKDTNTHRNDFLLSGNTEIKNRFNNYDVNTYLIKTNNNLQTLYEKNYVESINNKFITKDNNEIITDNDKITEINNWYMNPICQKNGKCFFSCDRSMCIFNPRFVSKGDISRSLNYFQLVYGYNPHNRDFEAENYYDIVDKENYKNSKYITAEYSKDDTGRNWFKDLFLGNEHDCEFYQSLEVSPPDFYKKNIKIKYNPQSDF